MKRKNVKSITINLIILYLYNQIISFKLFNVIYKKWESHEKGKEKKNSKAKNSGKKNNSKKKKRELMSEPC